MPPASKANTNGKANGKGNKNLATQQAVNATVKSVCDILRRSNCAGAMQYVPELTWLLFLRILDEREHEEAQQMEALGLPFEASLAYPYRWRDWAAPIVEDEAGNVVEGLKRRELDEAGAGRFMAFVNEDLLPLCIPTNPGLGHFW